MTAPFNKPSELTSKKMVLLTADVASSHTIKRARFLSDHFELLIMGFLRQKAGPDERLPGVVQMAAGRVGDGRYLSRVKLYGKLFFQLRSHKPRILLPRGTDMILLARVYALFCRSQPIVLAEITDVYPISYASSYSPIFYRLEKWLYKWPMKVLATSPDFYQFYQIAKCQQLPWENFVPNAYSDQQRLSAEKQKIEEYNKKGKWWVNISGYFRCKWTLDELERVLAQKADWSFALHLQGYANGGPFDNSRLEYLDKMLPAITYHGPFSFTTDLPSVFGPAHFTVVTEKSHLNQEGTLNLSNRIYESIAHFTPCIAIGESAISQYVERHKLGLVFASFDDMAAYLQKLTTEAYERLYSEIGFAEFARYQQLEEELLTGFVSTLGNE
jgi:hypothetical protein